MSNLENPKFGRLDPNSLLTIYIIGLYLQLLSTQFKYNMNHYYLFEFQHKFKKT